MPPAAFLQRELTCLAGLLGLNEKRCAACHAPFICANACDKDLTAWVCPACAPALGRFTAAACPMCALPAAEPDTAPVPCGQCIQAPPPWEQLHAYSLYEGLLKKLLLRFKFGQDFSLTPLLATMLAQAAAEFLSCDALVPIPQHPARLRMRGFNQIHELARVVATKYGPPLRGDLLARTRRTRPQISLNARQRHANPAESFTACGTAGLRVLLVDDTMTTGATLRHAAQALRDAGALSVRVAVVARAVISPESFRP